MTEPDRPLTALGLVDGAERRLLLSMGRGPVLVDEGRATLWSMFEEQVRRAPSAVAVECGGRRATYAATLEAALRVAAALRERGIGSGSRVGVALNPSIDIVPAVLGTMAAGAACVPIPPSETPRSVERVARDAGLAAVLVDGAEKNAAFPLSGMECERLSMPQIRETAAADAVGDGPSPLDAAWITYEWDADGRPRGTVIEHQAAASRFRWQSRTFPVCPGDGVLQVADSDRPAASVPLYPLIAGGCVVLAPAGTAPDDMLRRDQAAYVWMSPPALQRLLATGASELWGARNLRGVVAAGEAPPRGLEESFRRLSVEAGRGDIRLHVVYDRAETSGAAAYRQVPPVDRVGHGVCLGRPIANTRVYIVDERGALAPLGARGEIWIGGRSVARGYLERRDLTAQRFFRDPFASGGQVVRTGDMGRWRPDGQLEYLGRASD